MKKIMRRILSFIVSFAMLVPMASCVIVPGATSSSPNSSWENSSGKDSSGNDSSNDSSDDSSNSSSGGGNSQGGGNNVDASKYLVETDKIPLKLQYDEETPFINEGAPTASMMTGHDNGWQNWSLPIGNGYFGANVFGRTETERIQITEKTLSNPWQFPYYNGTTTEYPAIGGLNNFSETYIDFNHTSSKVRNYNRYLDLETAIAGVTYDYNGVTYTREYFTSYPDKVLVIRLDRSDSYASVHTGL